MLCRGLRLIQVCVISARGMTRAEWLDAPNVKPNGFVFPALTTGMPLFLFALFFCDFVKCFVLCRVYCSKQ